MLSPTHRHPHPPSAYRYRVQCIGSAGSVSIVMNIYHYTGQDKVRFATLTNEHCYFSETVQLG